MRVTVVVQPEFMDAANHAHLALGKAKAANTYTVAGHQGDKSQLFAVSSGLWTEAQITGVQDPNILDKMEAAGTMPEGVDRTKAQQAQAAFHLVSMADENGDPVPVPALGGIVAIPGDNPLAVLEWLGLTRVPEE